MWLLDTHTQRRTCGRGGPILTLQQKAGGGCLGYIIQRLGCINTPVFRCTCAFVWIFDPLMALPLHRSSLLILKRPPCTERGATEVPERHLLTAQGNSWLQQRQRPLGTSHPSQVALNPTSSSLRPPHLHNPLRRFKQFIYIMLLCTGVVQSTSCSKGSHHIMNSTLETAVSLI